jgi:hypothetical protein
MRSRKAQKLESLPHLVRLDLGLSHWSGHTGKVVIRDRLRNQVTVELLAYPKVFVTCGDDCVSEVTA